MIQMNLTKSATTNDESSKKIIFNPSFLNTNSFEIKTQCSLSEVERMRLEMKKIISKPAESKYDINEFLMENYPTVNRVPLMDVKVKCKQLFKSVSRLMIKSRR